LIDVTQYAQELATKANRQLSNLDTANLACHVVVDSYYDSTTGDWWREYDDGWVEQGGAITYTTTGDIATTVTLLRPMVNAIYNVTIGNYYTGNVYASPTANFKSTTTTSFVLNKRVALSGDKSHWKVAGQGASV